MLSDLQIMNKWASVLTGYKSTGERIFEFARAIEAEVRIQKSLAEPPAQEARVPLSDEQKRELVTDYFAEDWAIDKAMNLLSDFEQHSITAAQKETP